MGSSPRTSLLMTQPRPTYNSHHPTYPSDHSEPVHRKSRLSCNLQTRTCLTGSAVIRAVAWLSDAFRRLADTGLSVASCKY